MIAYAHLETAWVRGEVRDVILRIISSGLTGIYVAHEEEKYSRALNLTLSSLLEIATQTSVLSTIGCFPKYG